MCTTISEMKVYSPIHPRFSLGYANIISIYQVMICDIVVNLAYKAIMASKTDKGAYPLVNERAVVIYVHNNRIIHKNVLSITR